MRDELETKCKNYKSLDFIVGMSRAGTTWLVKCLNTHPRVAAFGETAYWGKNYIKPKSLAGYDELQLANVVNRLRHHRFDAADGEEGSLKVINTETLPDIVDKAFQNVGTPIAPSEVFVRFVSAICNSEGKDYAVEKTPHHLNWIDRIVRAIPESRFVIMTREPYGFMRSYKFQGAQESARVRRIFARQYHPLLAALIWRGYAKYQLQAIKNHSRRIMIVDLNDIQKSPEEVVRRVLSFLEVPEPELAISLSQINSSVIHTPHAQLNAEDIFWMNLVAGGLIHRLGYMRSAVPIAPIRIMLSIVSVPVWALRMLFMLRGRFSGSALSYILHWLMPRIDTGK